MTFSTFTCAETGVNGGVGEAVSGRAALPPVRCAGWREEWMGGGELTVAPSSKRSSTSRVLMAVALPHTYSSPVRVVLPREEE